MNKTMIVIFTACFVLCSALGFQNMGFISRAEDVIYAADNNLLPEQQRMAPLMDTAIYGGILTEASWSPVFTMCCSDRWNEFLLYDIGVAEYADGMLKISGDFAKACISAFCPNFDGTLPDFSTYSQSSLRTDCYQDGDYYYFSQDDVSEGADYSFRITSWVEHSDGSCTVECAKTWYDGSLNEELYRYELIQNQYANPLIAYTISNVALIDGESLE